MPLSRVSLEALNRICCLIIAEAGMGKTCLVRTCLGQQWQDGKWQQVEPLDQFKKVLILAAEPGLLSVRDLVLSGHVEAIQVSTWSEVAEAFNWLAHDEEAKANYEWIFIDSLTEIADRCEASSKERHTDAYKIWGDYTDQLTGAIKDFRDLSAYSVAFTCLPQVEKDDQSRRFIGAAISGQKIKGRLTSYFDEVFYLDAMDDGSGGTYRALLTQPYERRPAKDRSGLLELMEPPNLLHIRRKILGQ